MARQKRKQAILEVARPLFAQNGFHGTSVRDIARAADVSKALLYKHFPSKEALYDEALDYASTVSATAFDKLHNLKGGAEALVVHIYFLVRLILLEVPRMEDQQMLHERLLFRSLLGDSKYARAHFQNLHWIIEKRMNAYFDKAVVAGDLISHPIGNLNGMWLVHHLAMALNLCHISGEPVFEYDGSKKELAEQAIVFSLRGIGMTESAIAKYFRAEELGAIFERTYE